MSKSSAKTAVTQSFGEKKQRLATAGCLERLKSAVEIDQELAERFGAYAGYETAVSPTVETYGDDPRQEIKRLLTHYLTPESHVLDLGCGAGQTLCRIAPQVAEAWGFDQEPALLEGARQRVAHLGLTNVTLIEGNAAIPGDAAPLPDDHFDVVYTERGPGINEWLLPKLKEGGTYLQELVGQYDGFHLQEFLGRRPLTTYAFGNQSDFMMAALANLGIRLISRRDFYYDAFFRDVDHLEAFLIQVPVNLSNWRLDLKPYQVEQDRAALELYARYNRTERGIRLLQHRSIFVGFRAPVHYYPVDEVR